jgi:amino acid permease
MLEIAGFLMVPYGVIGIFRATEQGRRHRLPPRAVLALTLLGMLVTVAGLGLMLGSPIAAFIPFVLLVRRGMLLYTARLRRRYWRWYDLWPGAWPDAALLLLLLFGSL